MTITETPLKGASRNGSPRAYSATARKRYFCNFPSYKAYFLERSPSSAASVHGFDSEITHDFPPLFPDARLYPGVV